MRADLSSTLRLGKRYAEAVVRLGASDEPDEVTDGWHGILRRPVRPCKRVERVEAQQHEQHVDGFLLCQRKLSLLGEPFDKFGNAKPTSLISAHHRRLQLGVMNRCRAKLSMRASARRPELAEERDERIEGRVGIRLVEDVAHSSERTSLGKEVKQLLEQSGLRLELVVDGHACHAGSARDRVDRERLAVLALEQVASCRKDLVSARINRPLAFTNSIRSRHIKKVDFVRLVV